MKIFITHGHDEDAKGKIETYLATQLGHEPVILGEQPHRQGLTIIEALEKFSEGCEFAVILLTRDDMTRDGGHRARQNVIHEIGFFQGRLGRSKVVLVVEEGVEIPSNLLGLFCLRYRAGIDETFADLTAILEAGDASATAEKLGSSLAAESEPRADRRGESGRRAEPDPREELLALLNEETLKDFLDVISEGPLAAAVRGHFSAIRELGFERPANEDNFIQARRAFWSGIGPHQSRLVVLLRQYIASTKRTLGSFMIVYEFGRILAENRRGHLAYELLGPLEDQMGMGQVVVPDSLAPRVLDGIGEAARFADDFAAARRLYEKALKFDPRDHFALKHLGTIFRIDNDFPKAKECFEGALSTHETYHVLFSLAYLYHDFKHYDEAQPIYDKCVQALNSLGKGDYYRVYFKRACLHLIRGGRSGSEEALDCLRQTLRSLRECAQDSAELDDFAQITQFAAQLLISLVHEKEANAIDALNECEDYLEGHIDLLTHSAFYCAYSDIERVLAENAALLPAACRKLGVREASRLERILDRLRLKHLLLQASVVQGSIRSLTIAAARIEVLVKPIEKPDGDRGALRRALRTFETPPWRSPDAEEDPFELCKLAVASSDVALRSVREAVEYLLDRASVLLWLRRGDEERPHGATVLKAFTAFLPDAQRRSHFNDYFYLREEERSAEGMARILGKKLMCLDPVTKNRVFINSTVGCRLACEYCYLPEYSIVHNRAPTPAGIDGAAYRAAIEHDNRVALGKEGSLLSLGSFCEPFLPEVADLTMDILRELRPLGNPIQIATKWFPGTSAARDLIDMYAADPAQIMVNLSLNDLEHPDGQQVQQWLDYSDCINMTIYIKPFLPRTFQQRSAFAELGRDHRNVSFVVGSFYVGDAIRRRLSPRFSFDLYLRSDSLVSPVVEEPRVDGFKEHNEEVFREQLASEIDRPVFRTASCALSSRQGIKDPLHNYETSFCIGDSCPNHGRICRSAV